MKKFSFAIVLFSVLFLFSSIVTASVILTNDRVGFEALGTIDYNYGFDEFGNGFSYPGTPWTTHGITYKSEENILVGPDTWYPTNGTPMMANNYLNPVTGDIDAGFDLFGFDAGYIRADDISTTISIWSNLALYTFNVDLNIASQTDFYGFVADPGEYLSAFEINTYSHDAAVMDNVTLGHQAPEPATILLLGAGFLGLVGYRRKRFSNQS